MSIRFSTRFFWRFQFNENITDWNLLVSHCTHKKKKKEEKNLPYFWGCLVVCLCMLRDLLCVCVPCTALYFQLVILCESILASWCVWFSAHLWKFIIVMKSNVARRLHSLNLPNELDVIAHDLMLECKLCSPGSKLTKSLSDKITK